MYIVNNDVVGEGGNSFESPARCVCACVIEMIMSRKEGGTILEEMMM